MRTFLNNLFWRIKDFLRGTSPLFGGIQRSSQWLQTKRDYEILHPKICDVCGTKKKIELHHLKPFHLFPELENDFTNLIWGCRDHHYFVYHLMSWSSYNLNAKEDATTWDLKIKGRP